MTTLRLRNHWQRHLYINVEKGPVAVGPAWADMLSSQWELIPASSSPPSMRIQNRWKKDWVLHIEHGPLEAGPLHTGANSAMWIVEPIRTNEPDTYRIRNLWKRDVVLHIEPGSLTASPITEGLNSALWALVDPATAIVTEGTATPTDRLTLSETPGDSPITLPPITPVKATDATIQWESSLTDQNDGSEYGNNGAVALNAQGLLQVAMTSNQIPLLYGRGAKLNATGLSKGTHAHGGLESNPAIAIDDDTRLALLASSEFIKREEVLYRVGVANSGTGVVVWPIPWVEVGESGNTLGMAMKNRFVVEARGSAGFLQTSKIRLRVGHLTNRRIEWLPKSPQPIIGSYPSVAINSAGHVFMVFRKAPNNPFSFSTDLALVSLSTDAKQGFDFLHEPKPVVIEGVAADKVAIATNDDRAVVLAYVAPVSGGVRYRIGQSFLNRVIWGADQQVPTDLYAPRVYGGQETPKNVDVSINKEGKVVFAISTFRASDKLTRVRVVVGQLANFEVKPDFIPEGRGG